MKIFLIKFKKSVDKIIELLYNIIKLRETIKTIKTRKKENKNENKRFY